MKFRKIKNTNDNLCTTEAFDGQSIEEKVFEAVNSKSPIEAVAPMVYSERKDGVLPETNIRTDRFEIAQEAMNSIAIGVRERRLKRMLNNETKKEDKPVSGNSLLNNDTSVLN